VTEGLQEQLQQILGEHYRIDRELGGAGMSRVFVATDVALDRQVVIKVLPPELAAGINTDRFRREIQLAAKLQHPHIVPLLSAGAQGALLYYTMPFVTGENLRTRLTRTRELPINEAIRILREVADALAYAHSHGTVHRDIKPENILLSGNHALVVDFGVSKALASATSETKVGGGATLTSMGIALGTPAYMAPEQAAADPMVDHRADIYALGIVGYEILSGRTPFAGMNPQQMLSAHVTTEPEHITKHRAQVSPGLAAIIMKCLEKHPSDRWQSAAELCEQLEANSVTSGATLPIQQSVKRPFEWTPQRIGVAAAVVGVVLAGLVISSIAFRSSGSTYTVGNTRQLTNAPGLEIHPAISPDGRFVAYTIERGSDVLVEQQVEGGRAVILTDSTHPARFPRWMPDGSKIVVTPTGIVPALGGTIKQLPLEQGWRQCAPSNSGSRIACTSGKNGGLYVANIDGTNAVMLDSAKVTEPFVLPAWSPDDKKLAYVLGNNSFLTGPTIGNLAPSEVRVISSSGGKAAQISDNQHLNTSPVWTPDGALLYVSTRGGARDIYLQRLNSSGEVRGEPTRLTTGLNAHTISISRDGHLLAYSVLTTTSNVWATPINQNPSAAKMRPITSGSQTIESGVVSPDGKFLTYDSNLPGNSEIFVRNLTTGETEQITHSMSDNFSSSWSPDGTQIVFHSLRNGTRDIFTIPASGGKEHEVVATPAQERVPFFVTDNMIVYRVDPAGVWLVSRESPEKPWGKPRFIIDGTAVQVSPDHRLLAMSRASTESEPNRGGLWIVNVDGSNPRKILASDPANPVITVNWAKDSQNIYFMGRNAKANAFTINSISVKGGPVKTLVTFSDPIRQPFRFEFSNDGKDFYFTTGSRESDIWVMELKKE
jgi:serine/threonine protein kinase